MLSAIDRTWESENSFVPYFEALPNPRVSFALDYHYVRAATFFAPPIFISFILPE